MLALFIYFSFILFLSCFLWFWYFRQFVLINRLLVQPWLVWNSPCRLGWPQTHEDEPVSVSQARIKGCATMPGLLLFY